MGKDFSFRDIFNRLHEGGDGTIYDKAPLPDSGKTEWIFGRGADCDFIWHQKNVSREHFKVELIDGHYYITDLDSTNGTYLNGEPVLRKERIFSGDVVSMGSTDLVFDASLLK